MNFSRSWRVSIPSFLSFSGIQAQARAKGCTNRNQRGKRQFGITFRPSQTINRYHYTLELIHLVLLDTAPRRRGKRRTKPSFPINSMASKKKRGKLEQIWVFWAIMALHALAIFIFTRGFLLTRTELPYFSHCSDIFQSPCFFNSSISESQSNSQIFPIPNRTHVEDQRCWTKPAIGRLVIIVLDALRFLILLLS